MCSTPSTKQPSLRATTPPPARTSRPTAGGAAEQRAARRPGLCLPAIAHDRHGSVCAGARGAAARPGPVTHGPLCLGAYPRPQAGKALEHQLPKLNGQLKIGVISSLGTRGQGVSLLRPLLHDSDEAVARAAAIALGRIASAGREQGPGFGQAPARAGRRVCRCLDVVRREVAGCRPCEGSQSHLPTAAEEQSSRVGPPGRRTRSQSLPDRPNLT